MNKKIFIVIHREKVALVNQSGESIKEITFLTNSIQTFDDEVVVSASPQYKFFDIPSDSYFIFEEIDPMEDGIINYFDAKIVFENGREDRINILNKVEIWGGGKIPGSQIERKVSWVI